MNLTNQRRMAAEILKCGLHRVVIKSKMQEDVADAITRADIRNMIAGGAIIKRPKRGNSRARANRIRLQKAKGKRKGPGSRKGAKGTREPKKRRWIKQIRPQRALLKVLRDDGELDRSIYRKYYRQAKGGMFRSRAHLRAQLEAAGVLGGEA